MTRQSKVRTRQSGAALNFAYSRAPSNTGNTVDTVSACNHTLSPTKAQLETQDALLLGAALEDADVPDGFSSFFCTTETVVP
jgi:hypothetical protein